VKYSPGFCKELISPQEGNGGKKLKPGSRKDKREKGGRGGGSWGLLSTRPGGLGGETPRGGGNRKPDCRKKGASVVGGHRGKRTNEKGTF